MVQPDGAFLSNGNREEELKALRSDAVETISENQRGKTSYYLYTSLRGLQN